MKNFFKQYALKGFFGGTGGGSTDQTYILVDETGKEFTAVMVDEKTVFDATANDIRFGKVAATETGVTTGTKDIPAYYTMEGYEKIRSGKPMRINLYSHLCEYTKLQVLVCAYGDSFNGSVSTEKVAIDGRVYAVNSTIPLAEVVVDSENQAIDLSLVNDNENAVLIRFFTYKEVY